MKFELVLCPVCEVIEMNFLEEDEETDIPSYLAHIGEQTAFMKWNTEMEQKPYVVSKEFLQRHRNLIIDIDKFLPLSNINSAKAIKLFHLRRNNIMLADTAGLHDIGEKTALSNVADYNTTRGIGGFLQNAIITERKMLEERKSGEKGGWRRLGEIIRGKREREINEWVGGEAY